MTVYAFAFSPNHFQFHNITFFFFFCCGPIGKHLRAIFILIMGQQQECFKLKTKFSFIFFFTIPNRSIEIKQKITNLKRFRFQRKINKKLKRYHKMINEKIGWILGWCSVCNIKWKWITFKSMMANLIRRIHFDFFFVSSSSSLFCLPFRSYFCHQFQLHRFTFANDSICFVVFFSHIHFHMCVLVEIVVNKR